VLLKTAKVFLFLIIAAVAAASTTPALARCPRQGCGKREHAKLACLMRPLHCLREARKAKHGRCGPGEMASTAPAAAPVDAPIDDAAL
jgi:hypothetical protein